MTNRIPDQYQSKMIPVPELYSQSEGDESLFVRKLDEHLLSKNHIQPLEESKNHQSSDRSSVSQDSSVAVQRQVEGNRRENKLKSNLYNAPESYFRLNLNRKLSRVSSKDIVSGRNRLKSFNSYHKFESEACKSNYSKISKFAPSRPFHSDSEKIPKELYNFCNCASVLIVDDQIINRLILNEFGKCSITESNSSFETSNKLINYPWF